MGVYLFKRHTVQNDHQYIDPVTYRSITMSQMAIVAMLLQLCGAAKLDCSDVAILEIPNTNIIYVANCKPIRDQEGYVHYLGINRGFHYIGDKLHHVLIINNARCQKV